MSALLIVICVLAALLAIGVVLYLVTARRYQSSGTVVHSYDRWTEDEILEFYWGEHIHLGHYGSPPKRQDFLKANEDFVREMVRWGGRSHLRRGTTVLDVGCGIGGSSRILARDYGCEVTGVTISPSQIKRARELTPPELPVRVLVDDAMALSFPDASFDVVWSVEAGPHMPDKAVFAGELMRVLKLGGILVLADWNQRDDRAAPLNFWEKPRDAATSRPVVASCVRQCRGLLRAAGCHGAGRRRRGDGRLDQGNAPLLDGLDLAGCPSTRGAPAFRADGLDQVPAGSPHVPVDAPRIRQGPVPLRGVPRTQGGGPYAKRPGAVNDAGAISARAIERRIAWPTRRCAKS